MPKRTGVKNYRNDLLIGVIDAIKPTGSESWKQVAVLYQDASKEAETRDFEDIKRYWTQKLCNGFKKPTGRTGASDADQIHRCQAIHHKILESTASTMCGFEDDDENHDESDAEDDAGSETSEDFEDITAAAAPANSRQCFHPHCHQR